MSLSYLGNDLLKSRSSKTRPRKIAEQLTTIRSDMAAAALRIASAPHVLPAMLRVTSSLALGYWLVQLAKHHIS